MDPIASIIDERAVDPHAARGALDRLGQRARDGVMWGASAVLAGIVVALLGTYALALPAAAGGFAGVIVALSARSDRRALVLRLIGQRSAYSIPEVAEAARRMATVEMRHGLARSLTRQVMMATGIEPTSPTVMVLPDRVVRHADALLSIAFLLARDTVKVHPASLLLLDRLLTNSFRSPLSNPSVPEQHLGIALQRVRAAIDA